MVKKLRKMAEKQSAAPSGLFDSQLAQNIKDSAQQIWLAGLGAFAKAQGEGTKVFETLIKEGASLHRKTQAAAEERIGDVAEKMTAMAGDVGQKANAHWDKLESIFEERTARAMGRLGVPTAKDVAALVQRVDALAAAVDRLEKAARPSAKPTRKAPRPAAHTASDSKAGAAKTPRKRAAKPRVARKPAAPAA